MNLSNIDFALSLGQLIWKPQLRPIIVIFLIALLFPIITVAMICTPVVWTTEIIICISFADILSLMLISIVLFLVIRDKANKKKISIWLQDAVMLKAYSRKIDEINKLFLPKGILIEVSFELNGIPHTKESSAKVFGGKKAYYSISKYADRQINIMYSPNFDEVMILKDNF